MRDGFVKIATATPEVGVAACADNTRNIIKLIRDARAEGVKLLALPRLCISACTCKDLAYTGELLSASLAGLSAVLEESENITLCVGLPLCVNDQVISCCAVVSDGVILGIVPEEDIYTADSIDVLGKTVPFGKDMIFAAKDMPEFSFGVELGAPASAFGNAALYCKAGAKIVVCLGDEAETAGAAQRRNELVSAFSEGLCCTYMLVSSGAGESTTDLVYSGHNLIAECGTVLAEDRFESAVCATETDVFAMAYKRRTDKSYPKNTVALRKIGFTAGVEQTSLTRYISSAPFEPADPDTLDELITLQALGLKKRFLHTRSKKFVVGISGGLDSTLALLVCVRCADMLKLPHESILAVTMPCFGTTDRTKNNALTICTELGTELRTVNIANSVRCHFDDIGHDESDRGVVYENSQARERTQVLMDLANSCGGLVIGTGDLSELALGWATYNGDHMSMYGVNASVPKTLIRSAVRYYAENCAGEALAEALFDILDTPVSPELLPADGENISQKTEELVGPYELHDFFIWNFLKNGYGAEKMKRVALYAFGDEFDEETVDKWLSGFYRRFVTQQFKRSCSPDAVKVTPVSLSPRGGFSMPSDASYDIF